MEISSSHVEDRALLLKNHSILAADKYQATLAQELTAFADVYLRFFPLEEWLGRDLRDLCGFVYGLYLLLEKGVSIEPQVQVFNPTLEERDWLCGRTVITLLQKDMPFLVDSVRIELNRREMPIRVVQSTVVNVRRDASGKVLEISTLGKADLHPEASREALIYLETSLLTKESDCTDLRSALLTMLDDVTNVVSDYKSVRVKLEEATANVSSHRSADGESNAFLQWLQESNFTFLGFREYDFVEIDGQQGIQEKVDSRLGIFRKLDANENIVLASEYNEGMRTFYKGNEIVFFSKASTRSNVHRAVYPDYIVAKKYDTKGNECGEIRFLGLFTYNVFSMSPLEIPILRKKVETVVERSGLDVQGYYGKNLLRVVENFPKEELFQSDDETLYSNILSIASINERHVVRLIARRDPFRSFVNCMVFVPRDLYTTKIRIKIQELIGAALNTTEFDSTTFFSESTLARAQFVFKIDEEASGDLDVKVLENIIRDITRNWDEHLQSALIDHLGETKGVHYFSLYRNAFSQGYQEQFDARTAANDIDMVESLKDGDDIAMNLYQAVGASSGSMRFKVMHLASSLELSDVIPILENLGLRVLGEHPYKITKKDGTCVWLHDFELTFSLPITVDVHAVRGHFEEAFATIWRGDCGSDAFNRLVLGARLNWREVVLLRAYAGYLKQIGFISSTQFIADTLVHHVDITRNLVAMFKSNFDPRANKTEEKDASRSERLGAKIIESLDAVSNLNEDRVMRRYLDLICGTLRTNYFQKDADGLDRPYISIKFSPRDIPDIPEPRPLFEIYVYSPRVEGVHLRGGKVARGGLRWSDRNEDYRTEVLGLVKAQQVKNAVIVPNGAKGGFVAKYLDKSMSRDEFLQEGIACYKIFIQGLLDITDNFVCGAVVGPENVIRKDPDDPYLVVAADKGTATFSDIANEISMKYGHWLGDAFASGGSQGYDHKGMGITAKGAWISVQRHFMEKKIDIQNEEFSVIGIGDMAGDVFGNGMLLSEHICLKAAFNHVHIFIDPSPDSKTSFVERKRLFDSPRTTWQDYNSVLISHGGGVFSRNDKSIEISDEMKKAFDVSQDKLTPSDFITALLKAPVDLIWNGGIGTYVKASGETHNDVGDKANDVLRVNGSDLRCKVFGEGGNLGVTQLGRVEYALNGGACNTDFIDNAAGVDCSDHEVNIKILLDEMVASGDLTGKQRNKVLVDMTEEVSALVLQNNYRQTLAISMAEHEVVKRITEYRRFINYLEGTGRLNRSLEFLPSDDEIVEREVQGKSLTRPELSVLISYAKVMLKEAFIDSDLLEDPYVTEEVETAFPAQLRKTYLHRIYSHRLKREIVGTQVANDLVNNLGITAGHRLLETTGAGFTDIGKAYIVSRDVFQFEKFQKYIESLDNSLPTDFQAELMANMIRRVRRGTRWFLRNRRGGFEAVEQVALFREGLLEVQAYASTYVLGTAREETHTRRKRLDKFKVVEEWALPLSMPANLFSGLSVIEASIHSRHSIAEVTQVFFYLLDGLALNWFASQLSSVNVESYWQALARESFIDDLEAQLRKLTVGLLRLKGELSIEEAYVCWSEQNSFMVNRWRKMVNEVQGSQVTDYAMFSVALKELIDLSQATEHCGSLSVGSSAVGD
ncbi:MAG: glutamate dehydrogenase [Lentisphaeria bacterium]